MGTGIDKVRADYTVVIGEWEVGRIYETRGGPDNLRWFWSLTVVGPMTRSDRVATLEEAKAQFQRSWDAWKAWAKLEEVPLTCAAAHAGGRGGRERKTPLLVGPERGFQRAVRLRLGTSWTPNRASRPHEYDRYRAGHLRLGRVQPSPQHFCGCYLHRPNPAILDLYIAMRRRGREDDVSPISVLANVCRPTTGRVRRDR